MIDLHSVKAVMNLFDRFVAAFFACMEVSMNVFEAIRENGITARQAGHSVYGISNPDLFI